MKKPAAIIFDLDDTLIVSDGDIESTWLEVCSDYVNGKLHVSVEQICQAIRDVGIWFWETPERHRKGRNDLENTRRLIVRMAFEKIGLSNLQEADVIADNYSRRKMEKTALFPKSIDVLNTVKSRGIKTGLLTNGEKHLQRAKIEKFNLERFFDVIQIEGEMGFGKPEEKAYLTILKSLGTTPSNTWIVGDNFDWEVKIPKIMGLSAIWHNCYHKTIPDTTILPDHTIHRIEDLIPLL
ncbi:HAD family hydrolase [bacterium]|nr:HAD family hydrolase [bacterium]